MLLVPSTRRLTLSILALLAWYWLCFECTASNNNNDTNNNNNTDDNEPHPPALPRSPSPTAIMGWLASFAGYLAPLFIIMSPVLSYGDQAMSMHTKKSSAGFSLDIPLIMLVASFFRYAARTRNPPLLPDRRKLTSGFAVK